MRDYEIERKVNASKEKVWEVITDFKNYPNWNSVLVMKNNDRLILGTKFRVTIVQPGGKQSNFKATATSKETFQSFSATQKIIGAWFFKATHYFIIKEIDKKHSVFTQKWELKGIIASMFQQQIIKELEVFNKMSDELRQFVEK